MLLPHVRVNPPHKRVLLVTALVAVILLLSAARNSTTHAYILTWADAEPDLLVAPAILRQ